MKKLTGLLLACTLLAALLLSGCSGQKRAEYRADVQSGVSIFHLDLHYTLSSHSS